MSAPATDVGAGGIALDPPVASRRAPRRGLPRTVPGGRLGEASRAATAGKVAIAAIVLTSLAIVAVATGQPSGLVPRSDVVFPGWFSGPLHPLTAGISVSGGALNVGLSVALVLMAGAYLVTVRCAVALRTRFVVGAILLLHAIWLLAPLMPLTDVFNYIGYARLGALHGINPYAHGIAAANHDPVVLLTTWRALRTPYGPLFTVTSYALAPLPLPVAYWALKVATVAASLGCVALVWRCARQLHRDPRRAALLFAANPLFLVFELGGFHNDVFMVLPILATVTCVLAPPTRLRGAAAGAWVVVAGAVKASAAIVLPFVLLGSKRRGALLAAAVGAAVGTVLLSTIVFGFAVPNLGQQSSLLSSFSVPNAFGQIVGLGGAPPWLLKVAQGLVVATVLWLCVRVWRGEMDWLAAAGWSTFALIASLSWTLPSYIVWVLPFAALARSRPLRRWTLILGAYLMLTFLPVTSMFINSIHYKPMGSKVGRASVAKMHELQR